MKQMTLIEMDGFLKGKCIPRDLKVNETNAEYLVRKFSELESKLETSLRECSSAGITIDNLEAKCAALLDERERNQQYIKSRDQENEEIALTVGMLRVELEGAKKRIAELEALTTPRLTQPAVNECAISCPAEAIRACMEEFPESVRDIVEECASIAENACRAAMLQGTVPVTDNTNQQFESLSRGDK